VSVTPAVLCRPVRITPTHPNTLGHTWRTHSSTTTAPWHHHSRRTTHPRALATVSWSACSSRAFAETSSWWVWCGWARRMVQLAACTRVCTHRSHPLAHNTRARPQAFDTCFDAHGDSDEAACMPLVSRRCLPAGHAAVASGAGHCCPTPSLLLSTDRKRMPRRAVCSAVAAPCASASSTSSGEWWVAAVAWSQQRLLALLATAVAAMRWRRSSPLTAAPSRAPTTGAPTTHAGSA
jgi:hypothetical protein